LAQSRLKAYALNKCSAIFVEQEPNRILISGLLRGLVYFSNRFNLKIENTMSYKLFIGIDQSKRTFDAAIVELENQTQKNHRQFDNNNKGFIAFIKWIKELYPEADFSQVLFCTENTGWYGYKLNLFLCEQKYCLWVENPLQIKLSSGLKRGKSDKMDAQHIARYGYLHRDRARLYVIPEKSLVELKQLIAFREQLVEQHSTLTIVAKEFASTQTEASELINDETNSLKAALQERIKLIDRRMLQLIEDNKILKDQFNLTTSVFGVGKQTAMYILVYTNGFTWFNDWKKFACYCGIAPFEYSSGSSIRGKTRISRMGNKKIKSLLTMCALNTIKKENEFKIFYDRRIA
jgi:transposase